ncbi:sulfotransferase domain-containing protein [Sulfurovum sp.]|uniref:sulfotransferase domain-containing protein n=1 Tax=Sulfurovum sp. TaxID=1969726 RepID=UPI0025CDFA42|nr:sulfotransferase domain-containing protein [Sulfurovum sp.]
MDKSSLFPLSGMNVFSLRKHLRKVTFLLNGIFGNYCRTVWLIGDGRSGTTWVSNLINWDKRYRELFEPFHPWRLRPPFQMHHYIRCHDEKNPLDSVIDKVFSGRVLDDRVNEDNTGYWYRGLLVKDIFATLLAAKVKHDRPDIKVVLLIRNPFAVALSKYHKRGWHWMTEPTAFLENRELVEDHLSPFVAIIEACEDDYILKQILIWSIVHYVFFRQFQEKDVYIVFYEELYMHPETELKNLFTFLQDEPVTEIADTVMQQLKKLSKVSGKTSTFMRGMSPIESWKNEIQPDVLEKGRHILETFGLDELYDANGLPHSEMLRILFEKRCHDQ